MSDSSIEKLKSKIQIGRVFKKGRSVKSGVLVMHFIEDDTEQNNIHIGVSVSKRFVPLAFRRNRLKRQIRAIIRERQREVVEVLRPGFYMILYKGTVVVETDILSRSLRGLLGNSSDQSKNT